MFNAVKQLDLERLLLGFEDIDSSVAELIGERMVDFGARQK